MFPAAISAVKAMNSLKSECAGVVESTENALREAQQKAERGLTNSYVRLEPLFPWSDSRGVESLVLLVKRCSGFLRGWKDRRKDQVVTLRDYSETGDDSELQNARKTPLQRLGLVGRVLLESPRVARYVHSRLRDDSRVSRARARGR